MPAGPIEVKPDPWQRFVSIGGLVTAVGSILSVLFVAIGLYVTNEANREQQRLTAQGQITDRFTKAVEQLGQPGTEKIDVRLGAIYALERIMRDSAVDQPAVLEILAAFVRVHAPVAKRPTPTPTATALSPNVVTPGPRPAVDIQTALTVLGRRNATRVSSSPTLTPHSAPLDLTNTNLAGANLTRADLTSANLTGADITHANLTSANLTSANLTRASLTRADITHANLAGANLTGANLTSANLTSANLTSANLTSAILSYVYLTRANVAGATLTRANLTGAILSGVNLAGADMRYANLTGAILDAVDLTGGDRPVNNLASADMRHANLTGVDLTGADLTGARLTCIKINRDTRLPMGVVPPKQC
ncbi:pentapeptide repeat-containing protein [Micromonospora sp. NPDC005203]|uniref:pentapeptide repeat-containing protein n=1 Tax=Micromonospora sp. NPDC005203 TaxID=3364226 RepID=UPI0036B44F8A